jgi:protein-S-isoprenylcysteine O-methyltransferase Ste14
MYKLLFIGIYTMIYYFFVYKITKNNVDIGKETINMIKTDFWTTQYFFVFFIVILISLVDYLFYSNVMSVNYIDILFAILIIISGIIEYKGIKDLKENYYPQIGPEKYLITSGIFKYIRHPIYLSALFLGAGIILLLSKELFFIIYPFIFISIILKVEYEEKYLIKRFDNYKKYKKTNYKLIPFIY